MLRFFKSRPLKSRRAFSLMEAAIVLGLVGSVVGGIWRVSNTTSETLHINQTIQGINIIASNIQRMLRPYRTTLNQISYYNNALFQGADGFLLAPYRNDPFGNQINIDHFGATTWQLGLYSLSKSRCIKIMMGVAANYTQNGLYRMDVPSGSSPAPPATLAQANTYCGANGGTLYFIFNLF